MAYLLFATADCSGTAYSSARYASPPNSVFDVAGEIYKVEETIDTITPIARRYPVGLSAPCEPENAQTERYSRVSRIESFALPTQLEWGTYKIVRR